MLDIARTENTVLSLSFARRDRVRRDANLLEDFLVDFAQSNLEMSYGTPQVLPIPDELDPRIPRILFNSQHGFSQILVSQLTVSLQITYSPEWQVDKEKRRSYVIERAELLWRLCEALGVKEVFYSSFTDVARVEAQTDDASLINWLQEHFSMNAENEFPLHTFTIRTAAEVEGQFYYNFTIENYRDWSLSSPIAEDIRLPSQVAPARGVLISGEFNDRHAWNERPDYFSSREATQEVIERGFTEMARRVRQLRLEDSLTQEEENETV